MTLSRSPIFRENFIWTSYEFLIFTYMIRYIHTQSYSNIIIYPYGTPYLFNFTNTLFVLISCCVNPKCVIVSQDVSQGVKSVNKRKLIWSDNNLKTIEKSKRNSKLPTYQTHWYPLMPHPPQHLIHLCSLLNTWQNKSHFLMLMSTCYL